uniref:Capsid protein n=1 Tax=Porcine astrovirus 1 TaxID=1239567 RepID=A0A1L2EC36_PASV1|nr:capsid protein precursor [Mamastrovirus 3]
MANNQKNVQPKVVTTTTTTTSRRRGRRRRRTPRTATSSKTTVRKVAVLGQSRRPPRRRFNRSGNSNQPSGSTFRQTITATLGTVGANQGNQIELETSVLINPALMKETTGANQYGPLQMYAANYSLWRVRDIRIKLTPLVGGSAVSGTAVRTSLNLSGQPGSPSWSALGARYHRGTNPGRPLTTRVPGNKIQGPKEGWFFCNTKNDPKLCIAGSLEIHSLGRTLSTYTNDPFKGPLFLVELTAEWEFKNYSPEPGMLNLLKTTIQEQPQQVKINAKPGEPITISIPKESQMARAISQVDIAADATPSEIIWQIFDSTLTLVSGNLPPPFNWLFEAGWWFVKRIANKKQNGVHVDGEADAGELTFQVYQSISDAQNDVPCIATGTASTTNVSINDWEMMQITPGNLGTQQTSVAGLSRMIPLTNDPIQISSPSLLGQPALYGHVHDTNIPLNCLAMQEVTTATQKKKVYTYSVRHLPGPIFYQNGNDINPLEIDAPTYPIYYKQASEYIPIGNVYAAAHAAVGQSPRTVDWTTVCWCATETRNIFLQSNAQQSDQFLFFSPTQSQSGPNLPTTVYNLQVSTNISLGQKTVNILEGEWYVSTFVSFNGRLEFNNYGTPFYISLARVDTSQGQYEPTFQAYDVGMMMNTATPLKLNPNSSTNNSLTTIELAQLRQLLAGAVVSSPPDPEMPPLEGEEEEEIQGAVGGDGLQRDIKNWVEFGHRKRPPTPFSPIEEEDEEDEEESDLDDDDYAEVPSFIKNLLTPEAKKLLDDLKKMGLNHEKAVKAAQGAYPHPASEIWEVAYHNALVDGLSPPSARDCAWGAVSDYLS